MILGLLACFGPKKEVESMQPYMWQAPLEKENMLVVCSLAVMRGAHPTTNMVPSDHRKNKTC